MSYKEQFASTLSQSEMRERSKHPFVKFETVGDEVWGHFVHAYTRLPDPIYGTQRAYTLRQEDGTYITITGKGKDKKDGIKKVFPLEEVALGTLVGVYLKELRDTGFPQKAKIIDIKVPQGEPVRADYITAYQEFTGLKPNESAEKPVAHSEMPLAVEVPDDSIAEKPF